jgi:predicted phosphodiesterase
MAKPRASSARLGENDRMKLGLISDIHGNLIALRAVLADADAQGVDCWWVLGDIVALGPDPVGVLACLHELPQLYAIGGNTERYVLTGDRPYPDFDDVAADPELLPRLVEVAASFAWTRGAITQAGWFDWLEQLPAELRLTLPDGTRVLGVHASPGSDDGQGIDTRISDTDLAAMLDGCDADIVFAGHTHDVTDRVIGDVRAVNLGSVSNPTRADRCATYAILEYDATSHIVEHRIVEFDLVGARAAIDAVHHPAAGYLDRFLFDGSSPSDRYFADDVDPSNALASTFGAAPLAEIPSRDTWRRG